MSFRIEEKVILHISDYLKILKIMSSENKNFRLFPTRKISSLYFDNNNNDMFVDSEEGNLPRKKIRIRTYPESDKKIFFLEKKINSFEGKFKTTELINESQFNNFIKRGIFDKTYNNCSQKFWVSYEREYFLYLGARFTVDKNINFHLNNKFINNISDKIILEVKSKNLSINIFDGKFPFMRARFSKYCEGFKLMLY